MNLKKFAASLTALACSSGILTAMPQIIDRTYAAEVVNNTFEVNYDGWYSDTADFAAVQGAGFGGSRGMTVTGRTSPSDGASSSKGFYIEGGRKYDYSLKVYSETAEKFHVTLLYIDSETEKETTVELMSKKVKAGEWTELSTSFKAPKNTYEYRLTITTDSTNDFVFDDVVITTQKSLNEAKAAPAGKGLKDEFANYFRVGNILNGGTVQNSTILADYIKDFNSIECENETKPDATLDKSKSNAGTNYIAVKLNSCAAIADFCIQNGIGFRGHTMVWHSQTPSWFFRQNFDDNGAFVDKNTMNARMESYIKNMFEAFSTQYPDLDLFAYDVCNECVSDDSNRTANNGGARVAGDNAKQNDGSSAWVSVYGDNSFVETAFTYARKYAPKTCKLFYNDYNEYWDHKRNCIYNMCKSLYEKGVLDGVGMQSHVPANATGFAGTDSYIEAMKLYLSIGCEVQITELDISVDSGKYSYSDQAAKYCAIAKAAMDWNDNPQGTGRVTLYQVWGPNDANSWLKAGSNGLLRDSNNQPKQAYTDLYKMLPDSQWGTGIPYTGPGSTGFDPGAGAGPDENGVYFHSTFEGSTDGWEGRFGSSVMTSGRTSYEGSEALLVQDRESSWQGVQKSLSSRSFTAGETYSFSVNALAFDGEETTDFKFTLAYKGTDDKTYYSEIASATGVKGEWVQLANPNYTIPEGATDLVIYVETSDGSTENFYIDDAYAAEAGKTFEGAGQPTVRKLLRGDTNFDEVIDSLDLITARKALIAGNAFDALTLKACDVDQDGQNQVNDLVLLQEYVLKKITEFPVADVKVDTAAMDLLFSNISAQSSWKAEGENNVLWTQRFGADPGFMVYKDRIYVFTTNDAFEYNSQGQIQTNTYNSQTINCFSSSDLVNWTDHGAIPAAGKNGAAKWAGYAWAPDAAWKTINGKDKFFLYFADSAGGIGVLTADSPEGPYTDPIGHALINKSTPGFGDVTWLFDPAVLVDDDGTGYLYVGGGVPDGKAADPGTARAVKLGDDMISLSGEYAIMNPPYLFEDSSILKVGDTYYYSYCTNWSTGGNPYGFNNAEIAVMTSKNPLGPFTYQGIALKNPASYQLDGGGNNHHSIVEFKGKYYVLYHSRHQSRAMGIQAVNRDGTTDLGGNYRSCHMDECTFSGGKFSATGTMKGVSQVESLDPYKTVRAATMSNQSKNIKVNGVSTTTVSGGKGEWIKVSGADFSSGADHFTIKASSTSGAAVKVCSSLTGKAIAYAEIEAGGNMSEITVPTVSDVSGSTNIYLLFSGDVTVDSWSFS